MPLALTHSVPALSSLFRLVDRDRQFVDVVERVGRRPRHVARARRGRGVEVDRRTTAWRCS